MLLVRCLIRCITVNIIDDDDENKDNIIIITTTIIIIRIFYLRLYAKDHHFQGHKSIFTTTFIITNIGLKLLAAKKNGHADQSHCTPCSLPFEEN